MDTISALPEWLVQLDSSRHLYIYDYDCRHVLFRTDGLVAELSDSAHRLLSDKTVSLASRWSYVQNLTQDRGVELLAELKMLFDRGLASPLPSFVPRRLARSRSAVLIMITQTCNLACIYCYADRGTYRQPTKHQAFPNAVAAIDQLVADSKGRDALTVTFFGGEPLLDVPLIRQIVAYCAEVAKSSGKKFRYSITTNATLVDDEIACFLRDQKFEVLVSFDGAELHHNANRPFVDGRGSFAAVSAGIRCLVRNGVVVNLRGTLTRDMIDAAVFDEAIATTKRLGARWIHLTSVDCSHTGLDLEPRSTDVERLSDILLRISETNMSSPDEDVVFDAHSKTIRALLDGRATGMSRCGAFAGASAVATNGAIYPCHRFVGMDDYVIGHVETGGIDTAKADALMRSADIATWPKCRDCMARLICGGTCFHVTADGHGGFSEPPEARCAGIRAGLKRSVGLLLGLADSPERKQRFLSRTAR